MPEYHSIQAYLPLLERTHREAIEMFAEVLAKITLASPAAASWLDGTQRDLLSSDGYGPTGPDLVVRVGDAEVGVRPLVHHWTPSTIRHLSVPWLEFSLLLESERIEEWEGTEPRFRPELESVLLHLVASFLPLSIDSPTFLTNEATDGHPWEAFTGGQEDPWSFDLAVVNSRLTWPRDSLPPGFDRIACPGGIVVLRRSAWSTIPPIA